MVCRVNQARFVAAFPKCAGSQVGEMTSIVDVLEEAWQTVVATLHDVLDNAWEIGAGRSGHCWGPCVLRPVGMDCHGSCSRVVRLRRSADA